MRFTVALMLQQQPADGLLLSAETTCYLYDIRCTIYYLALYGCTRYDTAYRIQGWLVSNVEFGPFSAHCAKFRLRLSVFVTRRAERTAIL